MEQIIIGWKRYDPWGMEPWIMIDTFDTAADAIEFILETLSLTSFGTLVENKWNGSLVGLCRVLELQFVGDGSYAAQALTIKVGDKYLLQV